jgi:TonB family protein
MQTGWFFVRVFGTAFSVCALGCAREHHSERDQTSQEIVSESAKRSEPVSETTVARESDRSSILEKSGQRAVGTANAQSLGRVNSLVDDGGGDPAAQKAITRLFGDRPQRPLDLERLIQGVRDQFALNALRDPASELDFLRSQYDAGNQDAAMALGLFMAYGDETVADPELAAEFFREAGANGNARAFAELGRMYLSGYGVPADAAMAEKLFMDAMTGGDPEGAFLVSMGHRLELFPDSDPNEFQSALLVAAESGHPAAIQTAYELFRTGELELEDDTPLLDWLERSAENGDPRALRMMGDFYLRSGEIDNALSALELSIEAGSLRALPLVLTLSGYTVADTEIRKKAEELVRTHAETDGATAGDAYYILAWFEASNAKASNLTVVRKYLEEARTRGNVNANVALQLMDEGMSARGALNQSSGMTEGEAYARTVEKWAEESPDKPPGTTLPQVRTTREPVYPVELGAERITGQVVLEFTIDPDGTTSNVHAIESSHPAFTAEAEKAFQAWTFEPATKDGQPVSLRTRIVVNFEPDE